VPKPPTQADHDFWTHQLTHDEIEELSAAFS
jgi:hypothetical protein